MALDLIAELEILVDALDREGISYALCGGIALSVRDFRIATERSMWCPAMGLLR